MDVWNLSTENSNDCEKKYVKLMFELWDAAKLSGQRLSLQHNSSLKKFRQIDAAKAYPTLD